MTADRVFRGSYYRPLEAALARARAQDEPALDPDLPIVDPHHHLFASERGRYLADDYRRDLQSGHRVEQSVFIDSHSAYRSQGPDALRPVGETEFVVAGTQAMRLGCAVAAGIVGHADLDLGDGVESIVEAHIQAGGGRFRGVRDLVQHDPGPVGRFSSRQPRSGRMGEAGFREGVRRVGRLGLTFDLWAFHPQLSEVAHLADACPDTPLILNHLGVPLGVGPYAAERGDVLRIWREGLEALARHSNVWLKIGGLGMPYAGFDHHFPDRPPHSSVLAEAWTPLVEIACDLFGVDRCMFESNFPADAQTCGYGTLWNAFQRITTTWSAPERERLFAGTARAAYALPMPSAG